MATRSRDDIAEEIRTNLGSLKPGSGDPCSEILWHIQFIAKEAPMLDFDAAREKGRLAAKALAVLGDGFPPEIIVPLELVSRLDKGRGPDKRFGVLQWLCAHQACVLIEQFSQKAPVGTQDGNLHSIAQLIREAVTGHPGSSTDTLRACKSVLRFRREHISA
jgi:hypothetical protein